MRGVRNYVRSGIADQRDPDELAAEVIRVYDLTPVEAGLAKNMVRNYMRRRGIAAEQGRDASPKDA
jgi:hypothetical protein